MPFDLLKCSQFFIINLQRRYDRWLSIEAEMKKHAIGNYTRFSAINGSHFNPTNSSQMNELSSIGHRRLWLPENKKVWGLDLTLGALGCAISHFELWKRICAMNLKYAIIAEDDTELSPDFGDRLHRLWGELPRFEEIDVIFLSGLDTANECRHMMIGPRLSLVPEMFRTTNLYLITNRGAQRMLQKCIPLHFQLDTQMTLGAQPLYTNPHFKDRTKNMTKSDAMAVSFPNMYACVPPLAIQRTTLGSDIQSYLPDGFENQEVGRRKQAGWISEGKKQ